MMREVQAAPVVQVYSLTEYRAQEAQKKLAKQAEASSFISNARLQLSAGNAKGVINIANNGNFNYNDSSFDTTTRQALADVQQSANSIQAKNLNQQSRVFNNIEQIALNAPAQAEEDRNAVLQWSKLAQQQQLAVARVQPLRVNLPTRGVHYAFTQILQTEVDKPLTIQFNAANTRSGGLLGRLAWSALGLLGLWIVVHLFLSRRPRDPQPA